MLDARPAIGAAPISGNRVTLRERSDRAIVSLATSDPPADWPACGRSASWQDGHFLRLGHDHGLWLGIWPAAGPQGANRTDQSDAWAVAELEGEGVHAILERLIALDLANAAIATATRTVMEHLSVIVCKHGETHYELLSPRSSARDFWEMLKRHVA